MTRDAHPGSMRELIQPLPPRADRVAARRAMLAFSARRQRTGSGSDLDHLARMPKLSMEWWQRASRALRRAGVRFGVAGGVAANNYMPPRMTADVDLVVRLVDLERAGRAVETAQWRYLGPLALYGGLEGTAWANEQQEELDLIGVPGDLGERAVAEAQGNLITAGLPTLTLPYLVALKLIAARLTDSGDIARMLGRADGTAVERTRAVVRRYRPEDLDELDQMIALGRLEYAPRPAGPGVPPTRCRLCGRPLTAPAAQRNGIGPDCARKEQRR